MKKKIGIAVLVILAFFGYYLDFDFSSLTSAVVVDVPETYLSETGSLEVIFCPHQDCEAKLLEFIDSIYVTPGPLAIYRKKYFDEIRNTSKLLLPIMIHKNINNTLTTHHIPVVQLNKTQFTTLIKLKAKLKRNLYEYQKYNVDYLGYSLEDM